MIPREVPAYSTHEFQPKRTKYCVVVHVWNEGERIMEQLKRMQPNAALADIIIADGNSDDGSTAQEFLHSTGVRTLLVTEEKGLAVAIRMGLDYALEQGYEGVITLDGNGKDGVEAIPDFISGLEDGFDLVQGSRYLKGGSHKNTPLGRHLGVRYIVTPFVFLATGRRFTDVTNGFRGLSRKYLTDNRLQPLRHIFQRFNLQLYLVYRAPKMRMKIKEIPVVRHYPSGGEVPSKITKFSTKMLFVWEMIKTGFGAYNP